MKAIVLVIGIAFLFAGVLIATGTTDLPFQVAPTGTSVRAWEHLQSGGLFFGGPNQVSQSIVIAKSVHVSGVSVYLYYYSNSGSRSLYYDVWCGPPPNDVFKGHGEFIFNPAPNSHPNYAWVTIPTTVAGAPVVAGEAQCVLTISLGGQPTYWLGDSTSSRIGVLWGEPYTPPPPGQPPPSPPPSPPPIPTPEPPPPPPDEPPAPPGDVEGEAGIRLVMGIVLAIVGLVFIVAAARVG